MNSLFTIELSIMLVILVAIPLLLWGFRNLPEERWQFLAILPTPKGGSEWLGTNITFYGLISAVAYAVSVGMFIFLCAAVNQPFVPVVAFIACTLAVAIPASRLVARWVEGGKANFTIGGATFVAVVSLPLTLWVVQWLAVSIGTRSPDTLAMLAAAALAYTLGEAIGRLGCLSFGCCYGKPLDQAGPIERALYGPGATTYRGKLKKIAYASNLENTPVIAVQSIASVVLFGLFLIGLWLFWRGHFGAAFCVCLSGSQLWRIYSETLRADYRGKGKFSAYQWMAVATCVFAILGVIWLTTLAASDRSTPEFTRAWEAFAQLPVVVALQVLVVLIVWYMGRSTVTGSSVTLKLIREKM